MEDLGVYVLFQFGQSRKPMKLDLSLGEEALQPIQDELQKIDRKIHLPLIGNIPDDAKPYILQRWSTEWHEYVDVLSAIEIGDGDKLLAVPQPRSLHSEVQKPGDHSVCEF